MQSCGYRETGVGTDNDLIAVFRYSFKGSSIDLFSHTFNGVVMGKLSLHFKQNHGCIEQPYVFILFLLESFHCGDTQDTIQKSGRYIPNIHNNAFNFIVSFFCGTFTANI